MLDYVHCKFCGTEMFFSLLNFCHKVIQFDSMSNVAELRFLSHILYASQPYINSFASSQTVAPVIRC